MAKIQTAHAIAYVIAPKDEEYASDPVVNSLNDRRFIFDQRIRDAYIAIITKHPSEQSFLQSLDDYPIVYLCTKHGEQAVARKAAWERVNYYFYQTDKIEEIHFYVLLLKDELGEGEKVKQWVMQQLRDNPSAELATLYFECVGYDHDVFRFLQEATAREAESPMKALAQQVENLTTLESAVSDCLYDFVEKQEAAEEQRRLHAESAQ